LIVNNIPDTQDMTSCIYTPGISATISHALYRLYIPKTSYCSNFKLLQSKNFMSCGKVREATPA